MIEKETTRCANKSTNSNKKALILKVVIQNTIKKYNLVCEAIDLYEFL